MQLKYRAEVDGLRALAVVPVILFHAGIGGFRGGYIGVDVFFVISGYLITSILSSDLERQRFSIRAFYERRARRILPGLILVMVACAVAAFTCLPPQLFKEFAQSAISVVWFSSNLLFWSQSGYFDADTENKPLLHTWSLAVEEQYYLLFPLFLMAMWRLGKGKLSWLIAALALGSFGLSEYAAHHHPTANFYLAPTRAWELLIGSLLALSGICMGAEDGRLRRIFREGLAALGLVLLLVAVAFFDETTPFPGIYALVPTLGTALVIAFAGSDTAVARVLSLPAVVGVGLVSYSAYLWHQPLLAFARLISAEPPTLGLRLALIAATMVLAYATWRFVEGPFRDRKRFSQRQILWGSAFALVALTVAGAVVVLANGFDSRYPQLASGWAPGRDQCAAPTAGLEQLLCSPKLEVYRRGDRERRILFVGDSLLMSMSDGIRAAAAETGVPVNLTAHTGCPILAGVSARLGERGAHPGCLEYNRRWVDWALRNRMTDVVIVSAFNRYLRRGTASTVAGLAAPGPDLGRQQLAQAFGDTTAVLAAAGAKVYFMRQLPDFSIEYKIDVNSVAFRQIKAGQEPSVKMPLERYGADSAAFFAAVAGSRAATLDASAKFCTAGYCSPLIGGRGMYMDNDHPSAEGDRYLVSFWAEFLRTL